MKNFIINLLDLKQEEVENIETVRNSTTNIVICTSYWITLQMSSMS